MEWWQRHQGLSARPLVLTFRRLSTRGVRSPTLTMQEDPEAEALAAAIAPEAREFGSLDLAGFGEALATVAGRAAARPAHVAAVLGKFWLNVARTGPAAAELWLGLPADPPVTVTADLLAAGQGDQSSDAKAELAAGFLTDALAPTNFLLITRRR